MNWQEVFTSAVIAAILSTTAVLIVVILADLFIGSKLARHEKRLFDTEKRIDGNLADMRITLNSSAQNTDQLLRDWDMLTHGQ